MATRNGNAPRGSAPPNPVAERLPHRVRSLNIADLPKDIREQLNHRLLEGETARELTAWLNALPQVQSVLESQFNGSPISEVNLTHWRQGGYLQWITERECFDSARSLADGDCDLAKIGFSAERLLNILTVRIGQLLMRWDFSPDESVSDAFAFSQVARKARILQGLSRSALAIHRIQSRSASQKSEPAASSANSQAVPEKHAVSSPVPAGEIPRTQLEARPKGTALPTKTKSAEPFGRGAEPIGEGAGGASRKEASRSSNGKERGEPLRQILSGPIVPSIIPSNRPHTPFKPDLNLSEILDAV